MDMALIDISEDLTPDCTELNAMCVVHGDEIARLTRDHATEVVALRRKIDALESALAVAEVARAAKVTSVQADPPLTSISFDLPQSHVAALEPQIGGEAQSACAPASWSTGSAFLPSQQPAVVSVESAVRCVEGTDARAVQPNPPSTADAARSSAQVERVEEMSALDEQTPWDDGEASFEERMAAREFFADQAAGREPAWRRWLLKKA